MTLLLLAALCAFAADAPAAAAPAETGVSVPPKPTRRPPPRYPRYLPVRVEELNCRFTMQVDAEGRVSDVDTSACYGVLGAPLGESLREWRFEPATLDGQPVPGEFKLKLKLKFGSQRGSSLTEDQFRAIYDAHSTLPGDGPGCGATVTVHADGSLSDLATTRFPRCMIFLNASDVDPAVFGSADTVCRAHFSAIKGHARRPTFDGCDPLAEQAIEHMAESWIFSSLGASQVAWDLAVTFAGE